MSRDAESGFTMFEPEPEDMANLQTQEMELAGNPLPAGAMSFQANAGYITAQRVAVPRNLTKIMTNIKTYANAFGDKYYYSWNVPNRRTGTTSEVSGGTIKLANDLLMLYGNAVVDVRVVEQKETYIYYARFVDLENGVSLTRAFQQRMNQKSMKSDDERQRDIAFQIGQSKAIRNVVLNALATLADMAVETARDAIVGKIGKDLDRYKSKVLERLETMGIDIERATALVGRGPQDWRAQEVARLVGAFQAIGDGMATVDDQFPKMEIAPPQDAPPVDEKKKPEPKPEKKPEPEDKADSETGELQEEGEPEKESPKEEAKPEPVKEEKKPEPEPKQEEAQLPDPEPDVQEEADEPPLDEEKFITALEGELAAAAGAGEGAEQAIKDTWDQYEAQILGLSDEGFDRVKETRTKALEKVASG